jgi:hypothetical protein
MVACSIVELGERGRSFFKNDAVPGHEPADPYATVTAWATACCVAGVND